jgi:Raf kinase inhibitor-like YbhB/YbcL family protein
VRRGGLTITSPAFRHGQVLPEKYTSAGADVAPRLSWTGVPPGTAQLVLICHDPDAPLAQGFTHWVCYAISPTLQSLPEGGIAAYLRGVNSFGSEVYRGPAPPTGHGVHHYFFHLYAVGEAAELQNGLSREELLAKIGPFILAQARIVGTYEATDS